MSTGRAERGPADLAFGAAVRDARIRKGWTQAELGERAGIPSATISKVESAAMHVTVTRMVAIADALEVDLSELINPQS